jgi:hypothetical protein
MDRSMKRHPKQRTAGDDIDVLRSERTTTWVNITSLMLQVLPSGELDPGTTTSRNND